MQNVIKNIDWILYGKKNRICFENPTSYSWVSSLAGPYTQLLEVIGTSQLILFDLMPLTFYLDLWTWLRYPSTWPACQNSTPYVTDVGCKNTVTTIQNMIIMLYLHCLNIVDALYIHCVNIIYCWGPISGKVLAVEDF